MSESSHSAVVCARCVAFIGIVISCSRALCPMGFLFCVACARLYPQVFVLPCGYRCLFVPWWDSKGYCTRPVRFFRAVHGIEIYRTESVSIY